ncbi:hypothetical protein [Parahaliea mediterranea]|uniref:Uncharacterized protein n=1 Tax=Parahaliea mediterranea TaxID=651086 RepID=A0A939IHM4_9GAMM|nr:hypothetical protein [Parahaliea mediterranea]MBN7795659.1 hypothetical protein [Parahaliea mediterranea]
MTDETRISYSFQVGGDNKTAEVPAAGGDEPLFAVDDHESLATAGGTLLVGKTTGAQMLVQQEVAMVLQHCTVFRTLAEHARHLVAVFPQLGGNVADAERVLGMVRDAGLLVSAASICERVNSGDAAEALDRAKAFVITCDRPAAVERLLESLLRKVRLAGQKQLYLVDDSRDPGNAARNREAVAQFNLVSPTTMHYVGEEAQSRLIAELETALPDDREAIRFLLQRERWQPMKTYGRARTLCLLLSVGDRCVIMDDDVLCEARIPAQRYSGVMFSDGMREAAFFDEAGQWQQQWFSAEFDPLSGHARCLGMGLGEALGELGVPALQAQQLRGTSASLFRTMGASSPVLVTQAGTLGDPGTANNGWLPNMTPASVEGMLSVPGGLMRALRSRQCWLGHPGPTVSKRAVMSQVTGLDNRRPLPPYFPALRGEDQLFGAMIDYLMPDSAVLEYDWAVPHMPLEERMGNVAGDSAVPRGGLQLVAAYLSRSKPEDTVTSFEARLESLATTLQALAGMPNGALLARYRVGMARAQAFTLQTINDRLADTGSLDADWKQYLEINARHCVEALQRPARLADVGDVPSGGDEEQVADVIRRSAGGFAAALRAWPRMREAARNFAF